MRADLKKADRLLLSINVDTLMEAALWCNSEELALFLYKLSYEIEAYQQESQSKPDEE